jgi:hypothetical protein
VAFINLSFEDSGAAPGQANGWTLSAVGTAETIATFDTVAHAWEDFEEGWGNDTYLTELLPANLDAFGFAGDVEGFEAGWTTTLPPF